MSSQNDTDGFFYFYSLTNVLQLDFYSLSNCCTYFIDVLLIVFKFINNQNHVKLIVPCCIYVLHSCVYIGMYTCVQICVYVLTYVCMYLSGLWPITMLGLSLVFHHCVYIILYITFYFKRMFNVHTCYLIMKIRIGKSLQNALIDLK